jgi:hypothetical protein
VSGSLYHQRENATCLLVIISFGGSKQCGKCVVDVAVVMTEGNDEDEEIFAVGDFVTAVSSAISAGLA